VNLAQLEQRLRDISKATNEINVQVSETLRKLGDEKATITRSVLPGYGLGGGGTLALDRSLYTSFVGAVVYNSVSLTYTNAAFTVATFDSEEVDTHGFHSTASNTHLLTIPSGMGGKYIFGATGTWAANTVGMRLLYILRGGGGASLVADSKPASPALGTYHSICSRPVALAAGESIELRGYQTSGGNLSLQKGNNESLYFWIMYVGV
jgi:hypothetical protein